MKKKIYSLVAGAALMFGPLAGNAQTTAMSYDFIDCAGNPQSIYADLDAGKALILEFFMTSCSPCVVAGNALEGMKADLLAEYPGMIKAYAFGFSDSYTCTTINNWVTTNSFTSIPSDSGATQVAYYGGMGMPTVVILGGGTAHTVLGTPYMGFTSADTAAAANDIRNFLGSMGVNENNLITDVELFPNPSNERVNLTFEVSKATNIKVEICDLSGKLVANVCDKSVAPGKSVQLIDCASYPAGAYIVTITADGHKSHKKLNILR